MEDGSDEAPADTETARKTVKNVRVSFYGFQGDVNDVQLILHSNLIKSHGYSHKMFTVLAR